MTTGTASNIMSNSVTLSGEIISFGTGSTELSDYGFCFSKTNASPTVADNFISLGNSTSLGDYSAFVDELVYTSNYYFRAYGTNSGGLGYGNSKTFTTDSLGNNAPGTSQIGDIFEGGIIAYIFGPNDLSYIAGETHGLIIASTDLGFGSNWTNVNDILVGTVRDIGAGLENTNKIVQAQGDGQYAAKLCYDHTSNGFTDWYLPSMDELNLVHLNKDAINGTFMGNNWFYWTSTERDLQNAWAQCIENGEQRSDAWNKSIAYLVRPMRSF